VSRRRRLSPRGAAVALAAGPMAFVTAWAVLGTGRPGYSPRHTTISHLAEKGASSAPGMTLGFLAFAVLVPLGSRTIERVTGSAGARRAAIGAGAGSLGVAAFALNYSTAGDRLHVAAASITYVSMVLIPLLGARSLARAGRRGRVISLVVAAWSALALATSAGATDAGGLQRLGLTLVDLWLIGVAVLALADPAGGAAQGQNQVPGSDRPLPAGVVDGRPGQGLPRT
jgi:hypothetical membrane protein